MARVIYSNLVDSIKGSVGGLTYHANTSGNIVRLKPSNKSTVKALTTPKKIAFSDLAFQWNVLSIAQKNTWSAFAAAHTFYNKYGEEKGRNGYNAFMSTNANRITLGLAILTSAPAYTSPGTPFPYTFNVHVSGITVIFSAGIPAANYWYFFYLSPPNRLNFSKQRTQLRFIQVHNNGAGLNVNLTATYEAAFNISWPLAAADNAYKITCACCAVYSPTGLASPFVFRTDAYNN
jgi:hypothetical protein